MMHDEALFRSMWSRSGVLGKRLAFGLFLGSFGVPEQAFGVRAVPGLSALPVAQGIDA